VADFARKFWRLFLTLSRPGRTEEGLAMSFLCGPKGLTTGGAENFVAKHCLVNSI
jgi:hypothetical protein